MATEESTADCLGARHQVPCELPRHATDGFDDHPGQWRLFGFGAIVTPPRIAYDHGNHLHSPDTRKRQAGGERLRGQGVCGEAQATQAQTREIASTAKRVKGPRELSSGPFLLIPYPYWPQLAPTY